MERQNGLSRRDFLRLTATAAGGLALSGCNFLPGSPHRFSSEKVFRSPEKAIKAHMERMRAVTRPVFGKAVVDIDRFLPIELSDVKRFSIANSHLWEVHENFLPATTQAAVKPWDPFFENEEERVPIIGNNRNFTGFRKDPQEALVRAFDRSVYSNIRNNQDATIVLETYSEADRENLTFTVLLLASYGFRKFIVGNELDQTSWAGLFNRTARDCQIVADALLEAGIVDAKVSPPAPSYMGDASYLQEELRSIKLMSKGRRPFINFASIHDYGPVDGMEERIADAERVVREADLGFSGFEIAEFGNPAGDLYREPISDSEFAKGHPIQAILKAISLGVNHITYYSLYNAIRIDHSLVWTVGEGRKDIPTYLRAREQYYAVALAGKILGLLSWSQWTQIPDQERVFGQLRNGLYLDVRWNTTNRVVPVGKPRDSHAFTEIGVEINKDGVLDLKPGTKPYFPGAPIIFLSESNFL